MAALYAWDPQPNCASSQGNPGRVATAQTHSHIGCDIEAAFRRAASVVVVRWTFYPTGTNPTERGKYE